MMGQKVLGRENSVIYRTPMKTHQGRLKIGHFLPSSPLPSLPLCLPPFFADLFHSFFFLLLLPSGWLVGLPFFNFFFYKKRKRKKTLLLNFFGEPRRFYKSMNQSRRPPPSPISVTQRKKISCLLTTLVISMQQTGSL